MTAVTFTHPAMFFRKAPPAPTEGAFGYLPAGSHYFDAACQTLRPQNVLDVEMDYYHRYNACGGRVQYAWGEEVDTKVEATRREVLTTLGLSSKDYIVAFTQSTTYAINLVTLQLLRQDIAGVTTTDIEHNSVMLPSIRLAQRWDVPHHLLPREATGNLDPDGLPSGPQFFLANAVSNIDGRTMHNLSAVVARVRQQGGISLIDAAQTVAHIPEILGNAAPDMVVFSGHKAYAPSLGVLVIKKELFPRMEWQITGGGMVQDVAGSHITFLEGADPALLEPGLQNWAAIIALGEALRWMRSHPFDTSLTRELHATLRSRTDLLFTTQEEHPTVAFHTPKVGSHVLAKMLDGAGIMARSGYFCCHHYLKNTQGYPPLLRISLGRHSTHEDITALGTALDSCLRHL